MPLGQHVRKDSTDAAYLEGECRYLSYQVPLGQHVHKHSTNAPYPEARCRTPSCQVVLAQHARKDNMNAACRAMWGAATLPARCR